MENGLNFIPKMQGEGKFNIYRSQSQQMFQENANPELDHKSKKVTEKFSENLHIIANEPSLAFFRIEEHVRKSLPQLVDKKHEFQYLQQKVQGSCFDTEYAIKAVKVMQTSTTHFQNIQDLLKNAMFMKQQIQYENCRRQQERSKPSMYRSILRTNTVDIPYPHSLNPPQTEVSRSWTNQRPGSGIDSPAHGRPRMRSSSLSESPTHRQSPSNQS